MEWDGVERRSPLTAAEIDLIAERAADKAIDKVYLHIGRSVVQKALIILGAGIVAFVAWQRYVIAK